MITNIARWGCCNSDRLLSLEGEGYSASLEKYFDSEQFRVILFSSANNGDETPSPKKPVTVTVTVSRFFLGGDGDGDGDKNFFER